MDLSSLSVFDFSNLLGSDAPAPGGGSVAALHGALGAALDAMVCSLTLGRKKYEMHQDFANEQLAKATALKQQFLAAMETDNHVFSQFSATLSLPKSTEEDQEKRTQAMQAALVKCTQSPLDIMELCLNALQLTKELLGKTNRLAVSDVGVAASSLRACMESAWLNVKINLSGLHDQAFAENCRSRGTALLSQGVLLASSLYQEVEASL